MPYSRADGSQYFPQDYLDAIEMVGAEMVPVMHDTPLDTLYPLVISMDAMIFSGGCDIDPVHYGCAREPGCGRIDPRRDQTELALFDLVLGRNIPVLGICRGIQLLNVALGGTLKQDISGHRVSETSDDPIWHDVRLEPASRLAALAGSTVARVNSYHHQVIDRVADGLVVTARADGRRDRGRGDAGRALLRRRAVAPGEVPEGRRLLRQHLQGPARGHALRAACKTARLPCVDGGGPLPLPLYRADVFFQHPGAAGWCETTSTSDALQKRRRQRPAHKTPVADISTGFCHIEAGNAGSST